MYDDDDFNLLDADAALESPLDRLVPVDNPEAEAEQPDVEEMLALLTSENVTQRMVGARAFCELQDLRATAPLIQLLADGCPLVRVSVAYALGRNPSPEAVEPLIQQYHADWNGYVRKGVVWALGNCRDRRALLPLIEALQNDISAVRLWAASSLGQMAEVDSTAAVEAIPAVTAALQQDCLSAVRSNCAWALGQLCQFVPVNDLYRQSTEALIEALSDDDLGVREDARGALLRLGDPRGLQAIEELELEGLL
ncbi:MAG: HEAT repeat domain-containing protein [Thermosynechococcaceae cyanobacterium MS004]|nr:HEAT repeat domain-containing protein [Thermosynechococcaceae cyanobacterium MS004]